MLVSHSSESGSGSATNSAASSNFPSTAKKFPSSSFCDSKTPDVDDDVHCGGMDSKCNNSDDEYHESPTTKKTIKVEASTSTSTSTSTNTSTNLKASSSSALLHQHQQQQQQQSGSFLSVRAERVKKELSNGPIVDAVVLLRSGVISQIRYNTTPTLKQASSILDGRPTIIGEFEDIGVLIVRPMHDGCCCKYGKNAHRLPFPFQNEEYCGDFLLYKVSQDGQPLDFNVEEYRAFQRETRPQTEEAYLKTTTEAKNEETEAQEPQQTQEPPKESSLSILRKDVEKKVRQEFLAKFGRSGTLDEIERSVNATIDLLIQSIINDDDSQDYVVKEDKDAEIAWIQTAYEVQRNKRNILNRVRNKHAVQTGVLLQDSELVQLWQEENAIDESQNNNNGISAEEFQQELNQALENVRKLGRADGQRLASSFAETFYHINGREPELNEITGIFRRIKHSLALEADEDISVDDGTAKFLADKIADFNGANAEDLVEYAERYVTEDLISRGRENFFLANGRWPNNYELRLEMVDLFQSSVVDFVGVKNISVVNDGQSHNRSSADTANEEEEEDSDYSPENERNQELLLEDAKQEIKTSTSAAVITTPVEMRSTPVKRKKNSIGYDVYFDGSPAGDLQRAQQKFAVRHKRPPTAAETENIRGFLPAVADQELTLVKFDLVSLEPAVVDNNNNNNTSEEEAKIDSKEEDANENQSRTTTTTASVNNGKKVKVLTTPVKQNKNFARYDLYFDDNVEEDSAQNRERGLQWFKNMCGRDPTPAEMENLSQFVTAFGQQQQQQS